MPNLDPLSIADHLDSVAFRCQIEALHGIIRELKARNDQLQTFVDAFQAEKAEKEARKNRHKKPARRNSRRRSTISSDSGPPTRSGTNGS